VPFCRELLSCQLMVMVILTCRVKFCTFSYSMVLDQDNPLILSVMKGTATCYSYFPEDKIEQFPLGVGTNTVLIAGLQVNAWLLLVLKMQAKPGIVHTSCPHVSKLTFLYLPSSTVILGGVYF